MCRFFHLQSKIILLGTRRMSRKKILFVCLGNTCRSPIAEAIFIQKIKNAGCQHSWLVDSAAIEPWHVGNRPNPRAVAIMDRNNLAYDNKARQITTDDFRKFDYILAMDEYNIEKLNALKPDDFFAKILLLGDFDPEGERIIRDPYCDYDMSGFEKCFEQASRACGGFLQQVMENKI